MRIRELLLKRITRHLDITGESERQFGLRVTGDHKWLARLRRGQVSLSSIERAEELLRSDLVSIGANDPAPAKRKSG